ncbi:MAG TPA: alginate lyase family protein [Planctomycetota bacterium]|nr:alginate lyase family protein [Planctomycetota bacterium]
MTQKTGAIVAALLIFVSVCAEESAPRIYSVSPGALAKAKARFTAMDAALQPAFNKLLADAEKALSVKPVSVMDKPKAGPSGDKHDYFSTAPYFWPDPTKKDGLPYIRKDGQRNPESHNEFSDSPRLGRVAGNAETLAFAFYFTGDEKYAEHAAKLLRVFFIDAETKMSPNFDYAQAVPGVNTGRGTGMIESRSLKFCCDAASLLEGSKSWSAQDRVGFKQWMRAFFDWSRTSKNGKDESNAKNNHGTFYDNQMVHYALFLGETDFAKKTIQAALENRIAAQIKPDGSQPLELAREDSFGYSKFNVEAWFALATLGEHVGVDVLHYETKDGASVRKALDFLIPYAEDLTKEWPYERSKKVKHSLQSVLLKAHGAFGGERYLKLYKQGAEWEQARENIFVAQ